MTDCLLNQLQAQAANNLKHTAKPEIKTMTNPFTKSAEEAKQRGEHDLANRITTEGRIVSRIIKEALARNFSVTVNNGEEDTVRKSQSYTQIMASFFQTDEDVVTLFDDGKYIGSVYLVYGNDGHDVISDYTATHFMETFLKDINDYTDTFYK